MTACDKFLKRENSQNPYNRADAQIAIWVQTSSFPEERNCLVYNKPVKLSSTWASLNPVMINNVIRVGGRLRHSNLPLHQKHPIILPGKHSVTELLINDAHEILLHAGPTATLHYLRSRYWIIHGNSIVKSVLRKCVKCAKVKSRSASQMMADLPPSRTNPVPKPFTNCGIDFAGPFTLKTQLSRGAKTYKAYICLFICMATRAIHAELVTSLTAEAFLAAFSRFTSRRGVPWKILSDNGTNFTAANKELRRIVSCQEVTENLIQRGIDWVFNPPGAPHWGGLWEAGVKSVKHHLIRVVGKQLLTYEEFLTILNRVEAILNSRPLLPLSDDPDDLSVLTPAHFIIGSPLTSPPEEDLIDCQLNTLSRWQLIQRLSQDLWKRWSTEFLSRLQQRPKWWRPTPNIKIGALVLINDPNRPPLDWRLGRVTAVHPSRDSLVRVVTLKTAYGTIQRPVNKLSILPLDGKDVQAEETNEPASSMIPRIDQVSLEESPNPDIIEDIHLAKEDSILGIGLPRRSERLKNKLNL